MLNLFSGAPLAAASTATSKHRSRANVASGGGATLATVSANSYASSSMAPSEGAGTAAKPSTHAFNAPEAESILGMRRLLVKIVGAKDLLDGGGARRSGRPRGHEATPV